MEREFFNIFRDLIVLLRLCKTESVLLEDITFIQFCILDYVSDKEILAMSDLHALLFVEKSTTTRLVEPLIKKGLLTKERSKFDSRAAELRITNKGKRAHKKIWDYISEFLKGQIKEVPLEEQEEMVNWMKKFINTFLRSCPGGN